MAKKQQENKRISKEESTALAQFSPPRLPYHPAIEDRFGIDKSGWKALVEAIFPGAQTSESVVLALSYCRARKLDPFKRCIHIVPIWDSQQNRYIDTVWPGMGELRTTAHRTQNYAGRDKTEFGPDKTYVWEGKDKKKNYDYHHEVTFPEWAQVTVYRNVNGQRVGYAGPQVYWFETYGEDRNGCPNSMWRRRPRGMIDKCAEAAALRAAFPEEVGNEYIDAEAHLRKPVLSQEVDTNSEKGVNGLKERLAEREQAQAKGGNSEEQQAEQAQEASETVDTENRDEETQAKINEQKEKIGMGAPSGKNGKSNLF